MVYRGSLCAMLYVSNLILTVWLGGQIKYVSGPTFILKKGRLWANKDEEAVTQQARRSLLNPSHVKPATEFGSGCNPPEGKRARGRAPCPRRGPGPQRWSQSEALMDKRWSLGIVCMNMRWLLLLLLLLLLLGFGGGVRVAWHVFSFLWWGRRDMEVPFINRAPKGANVGAVGWDSQSRIHVTSPRW